MRNESNVVGLSGCTINRPDQHFAKGLIRLLARKPAFLFFAG